MPLLLADIDAFYLEHWRCGKLESEILEEESGWIVMACSCGGRLSRRLTAPGGPAHGLSGSRLRT
jgi:hypothetical protein